MLFRYNPRHYYENNAELKQCIDEIASGFFSPEDPGLFRDIANTLLHNDKSVTRPCFLLWFFFPWLRRLD